MGAKQKIRAALETIMDPADARACRVWRGWNEWKGSYGWTYQPAGQDAHFLGKNIGEALEHIRERAEEQAELLK